MYGKLPKQLGQHEVECNEMMLYQYLPVKQPGSHLPVYEDRLKCYDSLIGLISCDYIGAYGLDNFVNSYMYITAKYMYQSPGCSFNRPGWHSDGFMTHDINYIWSDKDSTVFNDSKFCLTMDDELSLKQMAAQALPNRNITYPVNTLLRLDQYNIHRVGETTQGMRNFLKASFSKDKYDLIGNSHNYLLEYNWEMKPRKDKRNIPQSLNI